MLEMPVYVERTFNSPVEDIWNAITNSKVMREWYFDIPEFELEQGQKFSFYDLGGERSFFHECQVLDVVPYKLFKHTWYYPYHSDAESIVTWSLMPRGSATILKLEHCGVDNFRSLGKNFSRESCEQGWTEILSKSLYNFLIK